MGIISDQRLELIMEAQLNSYDGFVTPKFDGATLEDLNEQMEDHGMENEMPDIFHIYGVIPTKPRDTILQSVLLKHPSTYA